MIVLLVIQAELIEMISPQLIKRAHVNFIIMILEFWFALLAMLLGSNY